MTISAEDIFRALGDRTRLRTLVLLRHLDLTVGELALVLGQSQPRMSQLTKLLLEMDLVRRRKEGNSVFLSLGDQDLVRPVFHLLDQWAAQGGEQAWFDADKAKLKAIRADRASEAQRFFERNAARWDELRSLHVPDVKVDEAILAALGDRPLGRLLDIGTGTGRMLQLLAPKATTSLGIDRSPEMLRLARENLARAGIAADLRQADMYALPFEDGSADTIILHQVLHYAHHPEAVIAEIARVLAPGGVIIIVDVSPHDREDFRRRFAHARLGFADDLIVKWFAQVGLVARAESHLHGALTIAIWSAGRPQQARLKLMS